MSNHANPCDLGLLKLLMFQFPFEIGGRYYSQLTSKATKTERLNNLPKMLQIESTTPRVQIYGVQSS